MHQGNRAIFELHLARAYRDLFASNPKYAPAAARHTPFELAYKVTLGLAQGSTDKEGEGIKRVCKLLGIKHTYEAISTYLNAPAAIPGIEPRETIMEVEGEKCVEILRANGIAAIAHSGHQRDETSCRARYAGLLSVGVKTVYFISEDGKWMILCNGFQWGEPPLGASGCSSQVWDTKELALAAWHEQLAL